jgi:hypothetical protein
MMALNRSPDFLSFYLIHKGQNNDPLARGQKTGKYVNN